MSQAINHVDERINTVFVVLKECFFNYGICKLCAPGGKIQSEVQRGTIRSWIIHLLLPLRRTGTTQLSRTTQNLMLTSWHETLSAQLGLCAGNPRGGDRWIPHKRPVIWTVGDMCKSKQVIEKMAELPVIWDAMTLHISQRLLVLNGNLFRRNIAVDVACPKRSHQHHSKESLYFFVCLALFLNLQYRDVRTECHGLKRFVYI